MKSESVWRRLAAEETGANLIEYALIGALIVVASIAALHSIDNAIGLELYNGSAKAGSAWSGW